MSCACTYSEQEQLLLDTIAGKSNPYAEKHPRLYRLVAAFEGKKPSPALTPRSAYSLQYIAAGACKP